MGHHGARRRQLSLRRPATRRVQPARPSGGQLRGAVDARRPWRGHARACAGRLGLHRLRGRRHATHRRGRGLDAGPQGVERAGSLGRRCDRGCGHRQRARLRPGGLLHWRAGGRALHCHGRRRAGSGWTEDATRGARAHRQARDPTGRICLRQAGYAGAGQRIDDFRARASPARRSTAARLAHRRTGRSAGTVRRRRRGLQRSPDWQRGVTPSRSPAGKRTRPCRTSPWTGRTGLP